MWNLIETAVTYHLLVSSTWFLSLFLSFHCIGNLTETIVIYHPSVSYTQCLSLFLSFRCMWNLTETPVTYHPSVSSTRCLSLFLSCRYHFLQSTPVINHQPLFWISYSNSKKKEHWPKCSDRSVLLGQIWDVVKWQKVQLWQIFNKSQTH